MIKALIGNPLLDAYIIVARHDGLDLSGETWDRFRFFSKTTWADIDEASERLGLTEEERTEVTHLRSYMAEKPYPSELNMGDGAHIALHSLRRVAVKQYAWAIPSDAALDLIAKHGPIVEIGAGKGYWAALLASRGVDIVCYDENPPIPGYDNGWHEEDGVYYPVAEGGPEMAARHPDRTLFICWPPYAPENHIWFGEQAPPDEDEWERKEYGVGTDGQPIVNWYKKSERRDIAYEALVAYEQAGGEKVIYIGEGNGGCTSGNSFHSRLGLGCDHYGDALPCSCPQTGWEVTKELALPQWEGINDFLSVAERRIPALMPGPAVGRTDVEVE